MCTTCQILNNVLFSDSSYTYSALLCSQVGQPMVRVTRGKMQLGVVVEIQGNSLLVATVVPSRVTPNTTVDPKELRCASLGYAHLRMLLTIKRTSGLMSSNSRARWADINCL